MDLDFLRAIGSVENFSQSFCVLRINGQVHLYLEAQNEYADLMEIPQNCFVTGHQNFDSLSGHWTSWKSKKVFEKSTDDDIYELSEDIVEGKWDSNISKNHFHEMCERSILDMRKGAYFLINLTRKISCDSNAHPVDIAINSCFEHSCEYRYFYYSPSFSYLSLTPERFISIKDGHIISQPIKGTAEHFDQLETNVKDLEENTMVVDLVRADFAKVCKPDSIKVSDLQKITLHPGLAQMSSSIKASLEDNFDIKQVIKELMPIASVSGTPKPRVLKIISEYENFDRGIYCGCIGWIDTESNQCDLKVSIRGIEIEDNKCVIGTGAGITHKSVAAKEFEETELKATRIKRLVDISNSPKPTSVFTSTYISKDKQIFALKDHLQRLEDACNFYNIYFDHEKIIETLKHYTHNFIGSDGRIRIDIDMFGKMEVEYSSQEGVLRKFKNIGIALSQNNFSGVKSFPRNNYTNILKRAERLANSGIDDALIIKDGFIQESTKCNIFIRSGENIFTPKLNNEILEGILRKKIVENMHSLNNFEERNIKVEELINADEIVLTNSVRGACAIQKIDSFLYPESGSFKSKDTILFEQVERIFRDNISSVDE